MDEAASATMTITVQCTDANKFSVSVPMDTTVVEFKALIVGQACCPAEQQRLIHRGRVLKDEATLEEDTGHHLLMLELDDRLTT